MTEKLDYDLLDKILTDSCWRFQFNITCFITLLDICDILEFTCAIIKKIGFKFI